MAAAQPHSASPAPRWTLDTTSAEFHFESEAALQSGIARVRSQSWVADYQVDDERCTLWVRFEPGSGRQLH